MGGEGTMLPLVPVSCKIGKGRFIPVAVLEFGFTKLVEWKKRSIPCNTPPRGLKQF